MYKRFGIAVVVLGMTIVAPLLGVSDNQWVKKQEDVCRSIHSLMAVVHFYPSATEAVYLTGGLAAVLTGRKSTLSTWVLARRGTK